MESRKKRKLALPERAVVKILSGMQLRSIARFRSVCKEWKSIIDSDFFRKLSMNSSSSISWSILNRRNLTLSLEIVGHHGCDRWGLTNSLGYWIKRYNIPETRRMRKTLVLNCADGIVLLYSETSQGSPMYHVGNPLLQQWFQIPLPPNLSTYDVVRLQENKSFSDAGLVTKMEKGIVVGYKVVWMLGSAFSRQLTLLIYSSETGLWKTSKVSCLRALILSRLKYSLPLNGILHCLASSGVDVDADYVVSFNTDDDLECLNIPFPDVDQQWDIHRHFKRTITTSAGSLVYFNVFNDNGGCTIRVWRLVKYCHDDDPWRLAWKVNTNSSLVGFGTDYFPLVMHPLNSDIIYIWSRNKNGLVLLNLRTCKFTLHKEEDEEEENKSMDGCTIRLSGCKEYMDSIYSTYLNGAFEGLHNLYFSQFVLPRWLNPLPHLSSSSS